MTLYASILFIHITAALALFLAFGLEWAAISFLGKSNTPQETQTWLRLARLGPLVNGPALLVAILSGGYLGSLIGAYKQGLTMTQFGWIPASFVGIAVVAVLGGAINVPKMKAIRLAISEGGEKLAAALRTKALPVSVRLRTFAALGIVYMMAAKPSFAQSLFVLVAGLIVGLLFSVPMFSRKTA